MSICRIDHFRFLDIKATEDGSELGLSDRSLENRLLAPRC